MVMPYCPLLPRQYNTITKTIGKKRWMFSIDIYLKIF